MSKEKQVNVRLDVETSAQLDEVARKFGVSKSSLIRHFTERFLATIRSKDGMPLDLKMDPADARSPWGERKILAVADDEATYKHETNKTNEP